MVTERAQKAIAMIDERSEELAALFNFARKYEEYSIALRRLGAWESYTFEWLSIEVGPEEGERFRDYMDVVDLAVADYRTSPNYKTLSVPAPMKVLEIRIEEYQKFLSMLRYELSKYPQVVLSPTIIKSKASAVAAQPRTAPPKVQPPAASREVFIIHGHDEVNRLRLENLLRDHWQLEPIVLISKPGEGRTTIEKYKPF